MTERDDPLESDLAGFAAEDEEIEPLTDRPMYKWLALLVILALVVGSISTAIITRERDNTPGDHSPEAGFLRDMSTHHAQAVRMAGVVYQRTEDPEIRTLAYDILTTQQGQIGIMQGWLDMWDLSPTGLDKPMAWMGHAMDGPMPGMATDEELKSLETLPVADMDRAFLRLMIAHHKGGVDMAEGVIDRSDNQRILDLATNVVLGQQSEIDVMQRMLDARG